MAGPDRICLGVIAGAHGLDGSVTIRSFTGDPAAIGTYGRLADKAGGRSFKVKVRRVTPKGVIARIEGVADRAAAEALKGTELYVARDVLPEPEEDEFYYADLIGLKADHKDGRTMGTVRWVDNYGAGEVIEIALEGGGSLMLPFTKAAVPEIDLAGGRLVIDPPGELVADGRDGED